MKKFFKYLLIIVGLTNIMLFFSSCNNSSNEEKYTIKFDSNGGNTIQSQEVRRGDRVVEPNTPIKEGYIFKGWYYNDDYWNFTGYVVSENMTLEAKWEIDNDYWGASLDYEKWKNAGANINENNIFNFITIDEAEEILQDSNKNTFALFFGATSDTTAVTDVSQMQQAAVDKGYKGKIYFITTTELKKSVTKIKDVRIKLNIDISEFQAKVICVTFENGSIKFNTAHTFDDSLKQFEVDGRVNIVAVLEYVIEFYPNFE